MFKCNCECNCRRKRFAAGFTFLEVIVVLILLGVLMLAMATRYSSIGGNPAMYYSAAQYFADKAEITRQGRGVVASEVSDIQGFKFYTDPPPSDAQVAQVAARFNLGARSYTAHSRVRSLTPATLDKMVLYRERVR